MKEIECNYFFKHQSHQNQVNGNAFRIIIGESKSNMQFMFNSYIHQSSCYDKYARTNYLAYVVYMMTLMLMMILMRKI